MKKLFILFAVFLQYGVAYAAQQTHLPTDTGGQMRTKLNNNATELYGAVSNLETNKQNADTDLDIYAGITPSANVISVLSAVDYTAINTLLGLDNVDNTSDADKPVSTATQTALDLKVNITNGQIISPLAQKLVRNSTGSTITKGKYVYQISATGQTPTIGLADKDSYTTAHVIGKVVADIANNATGYVTISGGRWIGDTSAFTDGDELYLGDDGDAVSSPPSSGFEVSLGSVDYSNVSVGTVSLRLQHPFPYANRVNTDTTNFDGNLSSADDTVQKALETLDELTAGSGSMTYPTPGDIGYTSDGTSWTSLTPGTNVLTAIAAGMDATNGFLKFGSALSLTNTTEYTPTSDYHPATKKYVDDTVTGAGGYTDENAQDAWGALLFGGTQTGITVTYDDANGTASYVVATQFDGTQSTTGNAGTATLLETARTIGGVSFDGSANIDLPGVNIDGNQNTTGSAATLTTPRTIAGTSFDGSANIDISYSNLIDTPSLGALATLTPGIGVATALATAPDTSGGFALYDSLPDITIINTATVTTGTGYVIGPGVWLLMDTDGDGLPDKVDLSTAELVKTDASGNLSSAVAGTDYVIPSALSGYQTSLTFDSTPTDSSTNPVTSGGVYSYFANYLLISAIDDTPVDSETSAPISSNWAYDHAASATTHGVSGEIVGTTDTQTLSGKTVDGDDNTVQDIGVGALKEESDFTTLTGAWRTTGAMQGGISISAQSGEHTVTAAEGMGTLWLNSGTIDLTLDPVAGQSGCVTQSQGVSAAITLNPGAGNYFVIGGVRQTTAGADISTTGAADDKVCWVVYDTTDIYITSYTNAPSE